MEVIKEFDIKTWSAIVNCHGCHSVLEFKGDDIICDDWFDGPDFIVKCPVCKYKTLISTNLIPEQLLNKAEDKYWEEHPPWYVWLYRKLCG